MTPKERVDIIDDMARKDGKYKNMLTVIAYMEPRLDEALCLLPLKTRNMIWDFIMYSQTMSDYVLELACKNMVFPDESEREEEPKRDTKPVYRHLYLYDPQK